DRRRQAARPDLGVAQPESSLIAEGAEGAADLQVAIEPAREALHPRQRALQGGDVEGTQLEARVERRLTPQVGDRPAHVEDPPLSTRRDHGEGELRELHRAVRDDHGAGVLPQLEPELTLRELELRQLELRLRPRWVVEVELHELQLAAERA